MAVQGVSELANLIPEIWSSQLYDELRNSVIFANIFSRDYEGEIKNLGDTVKVNTIVAPTGEILTDDKQAFDSQSLVINQDSIVVNKRASAAFEITDLAKLQSMSFEMDAQEALVYAIRKKLEEDIIAALLPSTSTPDHDIAPASAGDLAAADVSSMRTLLSTALVPVNNRFLVLAPTYYGDLTVKQQIASRDYVASANATTSGAITEPLYGFVTMEHNLLDSDVGYAVHRSALQLVMQQGIRVQVSNLHSQNKYGFLISADFVYGIKLFDNKRIVKISG